MGKNKPTTASKAYGMIDLSERDPYQLTMRGRLIQDERSLGGLELWTWRLTIINCYNIEKANQYGRRF